MAATGDVRRALDGVPLRVRLVAALLTLLTLALLVAGFVAAASLRGYLLGRVDDQLSSFSQDLVRRPNGPPRRGGPDRLNAYYVQVSDSSGALVGEVIGTGRAAPTLPRLESTTAAAVAGRPFTTGSVTGEGRWRVLVSPLQDGSGTLTVAVDADDVGATVGRLVLVEVLVGALVIVALGMLAYALVRSSLRPLVEVERTAAAIAAGDLTRRVPEHHPHTEVGRLSRALNGMLAQIEGAFRARATSEEEARASEQRMRRFVADASHELRTPLTSIRGFAELYRQGAVQGETEVGRVMGRVEGEATRMSMLVEELLLLARLDQDRPLQRAPVDLLAVAGDAVHDARAVEPGRPVDLRLAAGASAPVVIGDEARLRQVVANLLSNALVHTPAGTPVTVTLGTSGRDAVLAVSDTGPGIDPEQAGRIFERFFRGEASRSRDHGGSGLGLSIVHALVAAHDGEVTAESEPGSGATFRVRLPLADVPSPLPRGSQVRHRDDPQTPEQKGVTVAPTGRRRTP